MYKEVVIGKQVWMDKNLQENTFKNGDLIKEVNSEEEWMEAFKSETPAFVRYQFNDSQDVNYGFYYNWHAVKDPRGLAPEGWNIPNSRDFDILSSYLMKYKIAGASLKSTEGWANGNNGTNESNMNIYPGGFFAPVWGFKNAGVNGYLISSSIAGIVVSGPKTLLIESDNEIRSLAGPIDKTYGVNLRCIKEHL